MASAFQSNAFQNSAFQTVAVELPIFEVSGPLERRREELRIDAVAKGRIITVRCRLIPGSATASAKAFGDFVFVAHALAVGAPIAEQHWQVVPGTARSEIVLSDEEEFILLLAEAA